MALLFLLRPACIVRYDKEKDVANLSFRPSTEAAEQTLPIYGPRHVGLWDGSVHHLFSLRIAPLKSSIGGCKIVRECL